MCCLEHGCKVRKLIYIKLKKHITIKYINVHYSYKALTIKGFRNYAEQRKTNDICQKEGKKYGSYNN